jgi:hypothetical protein
LNDLIEKFYSSFDDSKSLANDLNEMEEQFRNPNLLIETIKQMQQKQEESLNEIQFKLNEINQLKEYLKETNCFIPFIQRETSLFGSIRLGKYSNMGLFKSHILKNEQQCLELINLCDFSPKDKWSLLYRATRDGFGATKFHKKCDDHPNTLTILKAKESEFIFGGFTSVSWESSNELKSDPNAFLFSLTNKDSKPLKMKIDPIHQQSAIYCGSGYGPTFGVDIKIFNNANTTIDSYSNLGCSYFHPQYLYGTNEVRSFLAGSYNFQLVEIEVYQREEKEI